MSSERRTASRLPTLYADQVVLRRGKTNLAVQLVDQSATGFQISVEGAPNFTPDEALLLGVNGNWYEVNVTRVERRIGEVRLGLLRVRDIASAADLAKIRPRFRSLFPKLAAASIRSAGLAGVCMACLFGFAIWTGKELITAPFTPGPSATMQALKSVTLPKLTTASRTVPASRPADSVATATLLHDLFGVRGQPPLEHARLLGDKLMFVAAVREPLIAQQLQLSSQQQQTIERILATCRKTLADAPSTPNGELGDKALDALQLAHAQVRRVLSPQQTHLLDNQLTRTPR